MKPLTIEQLREWLRYAPAIHYIDYRSFEIVRQVPCCDGWMHVIGHKDHGSYEWLYESHALRFNEGRPDVPDYLEYSNGGYGCSDVALRDGLIVVLESHPDDPAHNLIGARIKKDRRGLVVREELLPERNASAPSDSSVSVLPGTSVS